MKLFKTGILLVSTLSLCLLASCGKKATTKKTTKDNTSSKITTQTTKKTDTFDPEVAMNNFLAKIDESNYVAASNRLTTTVYGKNLITLEYADEYSTDFTIMSVNDEVFEGKLRDTGLEDVNFFKYGTAMEAATEQYRTLNAIPEMAYNIWDIFTNVGTTGEYVTNNEEIKYMLAMIADYPKDFTGAMSQVSLTLDKENPTKATFEATSTMSGFEEINLVVTFGNASENEYAKAWMDNPTYPDAPTEWSFVAQSLFDALYYPEYADCIPFVDGASYAFYIDAELIKTNDYFAIIDKHFSQEAYNAYISKLGTEGFELEVEDDGSVCRHKVLRSDVGCYASVYTEFNNGEFYMEVATYYNCKHYHTFDSIANLLSDYRFVSLPEGSAINKSYASDVTGAQMDSTLYINEYGLVLDVEFEFDTYEDAESYFEAYKSKLLLAYYKEHSASMFEVNEYYQTIDGKFTVKYMYYDNVLSMRFMALKDYIFVDLNDDLVFNGFASIAVCEDYFYLYYIAKDIRKYEHYQFGKDYPYAFDIRITFETEIQGGEFCDDYAGTLIYDLGFELDEENTTLYKNDLSVKFKMVVGEESTLVNLIFIKE